MKRRVVIDMLEWIEQHTKNTSTAWVAPLVTLDRLLEYFVMAL